MGVATTQAPDGLRGAHWSYNIVFFQRYKIVIHIEMIILSPNIPMYSDTETDVMTLTREQLEAGVKQGNELKLILPVYVHNFQEETRPKRKPVERQLNEMATIIQSFSSRHSDLFETLRAELQKL